MWRSGVQAYGRTGVTLVELLIVIAILGLIFGVSGLAFMSLRLPRGSEWMRQARAARARAIREGIPTAFPTARPPVRPSALFLPDGRAIGPGADPLTGAPLDAPQ
jgi:prepilin-type N-terminal cleavage/methylation domain-containing protein